MASEKNEEVEDYGDHAYVSPEIQAAMRGESVQMGKQLPDTESGTPDPVSEPGSEEQREEV